MSWVVEALDIVALSSFAIAEPLFDLLGRNAAFFVARQSSPSDVLLLAIGLSILPPVFFVIPGGLARLLGKLIQRTVHTVILAGLGALILLPVMKSWGGFLGYGAMIISFLLGLAGTLLYLKLRSRRFSLIFLSPAAILFPASPNCVRLISAKRLLIGTSYSSSTSSSFFANRSFCGAIDCVAMVSARINKATWEWKCNRDECVYVDAQ